MLDERIKVWADKIYHSDRQKFQHLIKWIGAAQKTYDVIVIARALERFTPHAVTAVNWWAYLDHILDKEEAKYNASNAQAESEKHKTGVIPPGVFSVLGKIVKK